MMILSRSRVRSPRFDPIGAPAASRAPTPTSSSRRHNTRVGMNVGHHDEAVLDELLGGLQRLDRIGKQIARIGMYLQLHPVRSERLAGQLSGKNHLAGIAHAEVLGSRPTRPVSK